MQKMRGRGRGRPDRDLMVSDAHGGRPPGPAGCQNDTTHITAEPPTSLDRQPPHHTSENTLFNFCSGITVMIRSKLLTAGRSPKDRLITELTSLNNPYKSSLQTSGFPSSDGYTEIKVCLYTQIGICKYLCVLKMHVLSCI